MPRINPYRLHILFLLVLFLGTSAYAGTPSRSRQEMRNLDSATKMHGLLESDHGRIYGWGQHDNYSETATDPEEKETDKPMKEQRPSPVHRFHPRREDME